VALGEMNGFASHIEGYDFDSTYETLNAAYQGRHRFSPLVESLSNSEARQTFLRYPNASVVNAKYLVENFILTNMSNYSSFIDGFQNNSLQMFATVGTVHRAMDQISKSFKI
jgi:hypothetical protein